MIEPNGSWLGPNKYSKKCIMDKETLKYRAVSLWRESAAFNIVLLRAMNNSPAPETRGYNESRMCISGSKPNSSESARGLWQCDPAQALRGRF